MGKNRFSIAGFNGVGMGVYGVRVGYAGVAENRARTDFVQGFTMCVRVSFRVLWCPYGFSMGSCFYPTSNPLYFCIRLGHNWGYFPQFMDRTVYQSVLAKEVQFE